MSKAVAPNFVLFVRSVGGHLVSRPDRDGLTYFGARVSTFEEREKGAENIVWDTDQVIPLTDVFKATFPRELAEWLHSGALLKVDATAYEAWLKLEEKRDADAQAAKKGVTLPADGTPSTHMLTEDKGMQAAPPLPPIPEDGALQEHEQPADAPAAEESK